MAEPSLPPASLFTPTPYTQPTKAQALSRADSLASGFILLKLSHPSAEGAYEWELEGTDAPDIYYPIDLLHQYASKYPESAMGEFVDDYCRWYGLSPPPSDEEAGATKAGEQGKEDNEGSTEEVKKEAQKAKAKKWKKGKKGMNARERRKARRIAGQEGTLSEDVEAEERDELVADMTVCLFAALRRL
jgi:superkiller protein 3